MNERRQVYSLKELTLDEAIARMPFTVLLPARPPFPEDGRSEAFIRHLAPLVPGYFEHLMIDYCQSFPLGLVSVVQGATCPEIDPMFGGSFSRAAPVTFGGRTMRLVAHPSMIATIVSLAFEEGGTHVVIGTDTSSLDRDAMIDFALSFKPAGPVVDKPEL